MLGMRTHTDDGVQIRCVFCATSTTCRQIDWRLSVPNFVRNLRAERQNHENWPIFYSDFQIICLSTRQGKQIIKINANVNTSDTGDIAFN